MSYNMTLLAGGNQTGLLDIIINTNNVLMGGILGDILLIGIGLVLFINMYNNTGDMNKAMMATFMICFMLSVALYALTLVHQLAMVICLIGLVVGIVLSYSSKQ